MEGLKKALLEAEEAVKAGCRAAERVEHLKHRRFRGEVSFINWAFLILSEHPHDSGWISRRERLAEQIERIWAGEAHMEIEDTKDSIQELSRKQAVLSADETSSIEWYNKKILEEERKHRDLVELVRLAQKRAAVSATETEYQGDLEVHRFRIQDTVRKGFEGSKTLEAIKRTRGELIRQAMENRTLSEEDRRDIIAQIHSDATAAEARLKPSNLGRQKPGSIHKEG